MTSLLAVALAAPWIIVPFVALLRARHSRSLDEHPATAEPGAPVVSVVIPARNEALNIERCVRSVLASAYPSLEVIVVDDHSTDGTSDIVRAISVTDARLRIVVPPPLPAGWFGKQWACTAGASASGGEIIAFFDADTWQAPDLIPRAVNGMRRRDADFLTVAGNQEMGSFWERMVQPQVFAIMLVQFGGTESVNESTRAKGKIANGQCIFVRRDVYRAMGGHAAVRDKVGEDLALAQLYFRSGRRTVLILGLQQLSTRMYRSLRELIDGWGKNVYAAGRDVMPLGVVGRMIYPLLLLTPALAGLVPPIVLALSLGGVMGSDALLWSSVALAANLIWWLAAYAFMGLSPVYAVLHPLGSLALLYIFGRAIARGRRVQWKERDYVVAKGSH